MTSWIEKRKNSGEKAILRTLFDKYVPQCLEIVPIKWDHIFIVIIIEKFELLNQYTSSKPVWHISYRKYTLLKVYQTAIQTHTTWEWCRAELSTLSTRLLAG